MRLRSPLFAPGDSERKMAKAIASTADAVILDLEDSVAAPAKPTARAMVPDVVRAHPGRGLIVRVNPRGTPWYLDDLAAVVPARPAGGHAAEVQRAGGPRHAWPPPRSAGGRCRQPGRQHRRRGHRHRDCRFGLHPGRLRRCGVAPAGDLLRRRRPLGRSRHFAPPSGWLLPGARRAGARPDAGGGRRAGRPGDRHALSGSRRPRWPAAGSRRRPKRTASPARS